MVMNRLLLGFFLLTSCGFGCSGESSGHSDGGLEQDSRIDPDVSPLDGGPDGSTAVQAVVVGEYASIIELHGHEWKLADSPLDRIGENELSSVSMIDSDRVVAAGAHILMRREGIWQLMVRPTVDYITGVAALGRDFILATGTSWESGRSSPSTEWAGPRWPTRCRRSC